MVLTTNVIMLKEAYVGMPVLGAPPEWGSDFRGPAVGKETIKWFKPHPLVLVDKIQSPFGIPNNHIDPVQRYITQLYNTLFLEYTANGCPTMYFREGKKAPKGDPNAVDGTLDLYNYTSGPRTPREAGKNLVVINPVYIGELDSRAISALEDPELDFEQYKKDLRDYLPESRSMLYALRIGGKLKLEQKAHPHFTNVIFIKDQNGAIEKLSHDRMLVFMRMMMKIGSLKTVVVTYKEDDDGSLHFRNPILGTMEGGHPRIEGETQEEQSLDWAYRFMAFGSSETVGGFNLLKDVYIDQDDWKKDDVVKAMINWGKFIGRYGKKLISPPIAVRELFRNQFLANQAIEGLEFERQAESAGWAVTPEMKVYNKKDNTSKTRVVKLVTDSGSTGAIKDDLHYDDISAVLSLTDGKVDVVAVTGLEPKKTSVEAEEFIGPLETMKKIKIKRSGDGYVFDESGIEVPVLRAGFHVHRGLDSIDGVKVIFKPGEIQSIISSDGEIAYFELDFPQVGCGVKTMQEMSQMAMDKAVEIWEKSGRKAKLILVYVPDHGINGFIPNTANADGLIPIDPYEQVTELIESERVVFKSDVPQDSGRKRFQGPFSLN